MSHIREIAVIEGHAFGAKASSAEVIERIELRQAIDARGDVILESIERRIVRLMTTADRPTRDALRDVLASARELKHLDSIEDEHCDAAAIHAADAESSAAQIIAACESRLTETETA